MLKDKVAEALSVRKTALQDAAREARLVAENLVTAEPDTGFAHRMHGFFRRKLAPRNGAH